MELQNLYLQCWKHIETGIYEACSKNSRTFCITSWCACGCTASVIIPQVVRRFQIVDMSQRIFKLKKTTIVSIQCQGEAYCFFILMELCTSNFCLKVKQSTLYKAPVLCQKSDDSFRLAALLSRPDTSHIFGCLGYQLTSLLCRI